MLTKVPFYYGTTRKMVVAVGGLFSNVFCVTKTKTSETQKIVNVPLAFANKEKFLVRLKQDPGLSEDMQVTLPRMSFEIVGYEYDSARQQNKTNKNLCVKDGQSVYSYSPVPYNITFNVYSYTRTQEDNLQIMEQILPFFTPDMNLSIKVMQNPDFIQDCQFILNSVNTDDSYDGGFEERRYIITTYQLTLKMFYYTPIRGLSEVNPHFELPEAVKVIKKVAVNAATNRYSVEVNPFDATATDPYTTIDAWVPRTTPTDFDTGVSI